MPLKFKMGATVAYYEVGGLVIMALPTGKSRRHFCSGTTDDHPEVVDIGIQYDDVVIYRKRWKQQDLICRLEDESMHIDKLFSFPEDVSETDVRQLEKERDGLTDYIKDPLLLKKQPR